MALLAWASSEGSRGKASGSTATPRRVRALDAALRDEQEAELHVASGRTDVAAELYESALRLRQGALGPTHQSLPATAEALTRSSNHAASLALSRGEDLGSAECCLRRTLAMLAEVAAGVGHAKLASCFNLTLSNLAALQQRLGRQEAALLCLKEAASLCNMLPHADAAATHLSLCAQLSKLGQHSAAERHAAEAVRLGEADILQLPSLHQANGATSAASLLRDKVSALAVAYNNLAVQREFLGNLSECIVLYEKAVVLAEGHMDSDNPLLARLRESHRNAVSTAAEKRAASAQGTAREASRRLPPLLTERCRPFSAASGRQARRQGSREASAAEAARCNASQQEILSARSLSRELASLLRPDCRPPAPPAASRRAASCGAGDRPAEEAELTSGRITGAQDSRLQEPCVQSSGSDARSRQRSSSARPQADAETGSVNSAPSKAPREVRARSLGASARSPSTGGTPAERQWAQQVLDTGTKANAAVEGSGPQRALRGARREAAALQIQEAFAQHRAAKSLEPIASSAEVSSIAACVEPADSLLAGSVEFCGPEPEAECPPSGRCAESPRLSSGVGRPEVVPNLELKKQVQPGTAGVFADVPPTPPLRHGSLAGRGNTAPSLALPVLGSAPLERAGRAVGKIHEAHCAARSASKDTQSSKENLLGTSNSTQCATRSSSKDVQIQRERFPRDSSCHSRHDAPSQKGIPAEKRQKAAAQIQDAWRRQILPQKSENMALRLQSLLRGFLERRRFAQQTAAARTLQRFFRRVRNRRRRKLAVLLQSSLRAASERRRFCQCSAASAILQRAARLWQGRRRRLQLRRERQDASCRLQRRWRRHRERRRAEERRAVGALVRRWVQTHIGKAAARAAREDSALRLQRALRGRLARSRLQAEGVLVATCNLFDEHQHPIRCEARRAVALLPLQPLQARDWRLVATATMGNGGGACEKAVLEVAESDVHALVGVGQAEPEPDNEPVAHRAGVVAKRLLQSLAVHWHEGQLSIRLRPVDHDEMHKQCDQQSGGGPPVCSPITSPRRTGSEGEHPGSGSICDSFCSESLSGSPTKSQPNSPSAQRSPAHESSAADLPACPESAAASESDINTSAAAEAASPVDSCTSHDADASASAEGPSIESAASADQARLPVHTGTSATDCAGGDASAASMPAVDMSVKSVPVTAVYCPPAAASSILAELEMPWQCSQCGFNNEVSPAACVLCDAERTCFAPEAPVAQEVANQTPCAKQSRQSRRPGPAAPTLRGSTMPRARPGSARCR
mmetsp:Transcript_164001/g.290307  ORF Transcript_164001/g.290307 Transcript_164001/m.290307 type:complete len:1267 (+) Transcript_164001:60-3860(+)